MQFTTDVLSIKSVNRKPMQSTVPISVCRFLTIPLFAHWSLIKAMIVRYALPENHFSDLQSAGFIYSFFTENLVIWILFGWKHHPSPWHPFQAPPLGVLLVWNPLPVSPQSSDPSPERVRTTLTGDLGCCPEKEHTVSPSLSLAMLSWCHTGILH